MKKISNIGKFQIGEYLENVIKKKLELQDSLSKFFDGVKDDKAFEIKCCLVTHRNTPRIHTLGRLFFNSKEHRRFKKLATERDLIPLYLLTCYFFNARRPTILTVRQASWDFVNNFVKGRKNFRIPLSILGMLKKINIE